MNVFHKVRERNQRRFRLRAQSFRSSVPGQHYTQEFTANIAELVLFHGSRVRSQEVEVGKYNSKEENE